MDPQGDLHLTPLNAPCRSYEATKKPVESVEQKSGQTTGIGYSSYGSYGSYGIVVTCCYILILRVHFSHFILYTLHMLNHVDHVVTCCQEVPP